MAPIGYATLEDLKAYVDTHYTCDDDIYKAFSEIPATHQSVALIRAFEAIEALPLRGRKTDCNQPYAFPRYPDKVVPQCVINAQCADALSRLDKQVKHDLEFVEQLQRKGVKSYKIGPVSETFGEVGSSSLTVGTTSVATVAKTYLQPWLTGGFRYGHL